MEPSRRTGVGLSMLCHRYRIAAIVGVLLLQSTPLFAQAGFEVAVASFERAYEGTPLLVRGRAYQIENLADLVPLQSASIEVCNRGTASDACGSWQSVETDRAGFFLTTIDEATEGHIVFRHADREIDLPLQTQPRVKVDFLTDRRFYERDEPVHAWALVRDPLTLRPLPAQEVLFTLGDGPHQRTQTVRTDDSGAAHYAFAPEPDRGSADGEVSARSGGINASHSIKFGARTVEPLFVEVEVPDELLLPGTPFEVTVTAESQDGEPIEGAHVRVRLEDGGTDGRTDAEGKVTLTLTTATIASNAYPAVTAIVTHPAHGTAQGEQTIRIGTPGTLHSTLHVQHGAMMSGAASPLYISVTRADGGPAVDEPVRVRGPRGFNREFRTDEAGVVRFEARADIDDAAPATGCRNGHGVFSSNHAVFFDVSVGSDDLASQEHCVAVSDARVRPTVSGRIFQPGQSVDVQLERRTREPVIVDLVVSSTRYYARVVASQIVTGNRASFDVPADLGIAQISAYPIGETSFGAALGDAFVIRPEPARVEVETDDQISAIGHADVRIRGGGPGWFALNVRDLSQHGGERPFRMRFLEGRLRRSLLAPEGDVERRLLAAALASLVQPRGGAQEPAPLALDPHEHGGSSVHERDPRFFAIEFRRRGLVDAYRAIEDRLDETPDRVVASRGRFRPDALADVEGFAGAPITPDALQRNDASFSFGAAAGRIARERVLRVLTAATKMEAQNRAIPEERIVSELLRQGKLSPADVVDPWGGRLGWRSRPRELPRFFVGTERALAFPGADGRLGTGDDILDPFARIVPGGTPYAIASGEDEYMAQVSMLSVGPYALEAMLEALQRATEAMDESLRGDAAVASVLSADDGSRGVTRFGLSGGSGSGSGYGRGAGGLGARRARAPRIRSGHANVAPSPGSALLGAIRDEVPGTLFFLPSQATDANGQASVQVPLLGAPTTYLVEVIHWRADGFLSSNQTRFHTQRPMTVRASTPLFATAGDRLRVPVRAANLSGADQAVRLSITSEGLPMERQHATLQLANGATGGRVLELAVGQAGEGSLLTEAIGDGVDDRLRRRLHVRSPAMHLRRSSDQVRRGEVELSFDACSGGETELNIDAGAAVFPVHDPAWIAWSHALEGRPVRSSIAQSELQYLDDGDLLQGRALGVTWIESELSDERIREILEAHDGYSPTRSALWMLLAAPALRHPDARPELRDFVRRFVDGQIDAIASAATTATDDPMMQLSAAAAMLLIDQERFETRARDLVERASDSRFQRGESVWVDDAVGHFGTRVASALMAICAVQLGDLPEASRLLATLGEGEELPTSYNSIEDMARALGRAAAAKMAPAPRRAFVTARAPREVPLSRGSATVRVPRAAGEVLRVRSSGLVRVRATTTCEGPWRSAARTPLALDIEAPEARLTLDGRAVFELSIRNTRPGVQRDIEVRVGLPSGVSFDVAELEALRDRYGARQEEGELILHVDAIFPGRGRRLPLPMRFGVAGRLQGLGVVAIAGGRDDAHAALEPRTLEVGSTEQ